MLRSFVLEPCAQIITARFNLARRLADCGQGQGTAGCSLDSS